ncbi:hypothetical protein SUGI_0862800 [Cryptomeria japonica]|nr:hypothetical protein SUGI_0862800 [Cryptomeria japonica]
MADNEKWKGIEKSEERRAEWHQALNVIRRIKGLKFSEGGNELEFREKIVKEIWRKLPTQSPRYHVAGIQGEERMCQEVANFFNNVHPNEKGIRFAGLYGIAGHGKTTLGKAICNFKLADFEDGLVDRSGYGLDDVFAALGKASDDMHPIYRTVFMLLSLLFWDISLTNFFHYVVGSILFRLRIIVFLGPLFKSC